MPAIFPLDADRSSRCFARMDPADANLSGATDGIRLQHALPLRQPVPALRVRSDIPNEVAEALPDALPQSAEYATTGGEAGMGDASSLPGDATDHPETLTPAVDNSQPPAGTGPSSHLPQLSAGLEPPITPTMDMVRDDPVQTPASEEMAADVRGASFAPRPNFRGTQAESATIPLRFFSGAPQKAAGPGDIRTESFPIIPNAAAPAQDTAKAADLAPESLTDEAMPEVVGPAAQLEMSPNVTMVPTKRGSSVSPPIGEAKSGATVPQSVPTPLPRENTPLVGTESPGKNLPVDTRVPAAVPPGLPHSIRLKEKFAADHPRYALLPEVKHAPAIGSDKKETLVISDEAFASHASGIGIETANPVAPMLHDIRQTRLAALQGETPISAAGGGMTSGHLGRSDSAMFELRGGPAAAAVETIRRITDAADVLWATDRTGMNLKLRLDDVGVSVSLAYRDGEIRTTFHTDSVDLRDALSSAWKAHAVNVAEQRPYRLAEPVFSSSGSATGGGSSGQGFSLGGDSSHHSSHNYQGGRDGFESATHPQAAARATGVPAPASTRPAPLPDATGRLHTFA